MLRISKRILSILIIISYALSIASTAFAASPPDVPKGPDLNLINKWIDKKLATTQYNGNFNKDEILKRVDFFTYINKIFNYVDKANTSFSDVIKDTSAANEVGKAVAAGYLEADKDGKAAPFSPITRLDAAVILAKVFELHAANSNTYEDYNDADKIPDAAKDAVSVMKEKGYVESRPDGNFVPYGTLTRIQAIRMIDKVMGGIVNESGKNYISNAAGNLVVSAGNVTLSDITVSGDLYLTPGIGSGNVTLDTVTVKGRTIIHGGGEKSVVVKNSSLQGIVTVNKNDGKVRVVAEGSTSIPNIQIMSGAILEGNSSANGGFGTVKLLDGIPQAQTVTLRGKVNNVSAEADNVTVQTSANVSNFEVKAGANNTNINVLDGTINQISVLSDMTTINLKKGTITKMDVQENANATKVTVDGTSNVGSLNANGDVSINLLGGKVAALNINSGAAGSNLNVGSGATVNNLSASGSVTVTGQGKIQNANVSSSNVSFEKKPDLFVLTPGVTVSIGGGETYTSTASVPGSLIVDVPSATVGAYRTINLIYTPTEALSGATVVFNIPTGFSATTSDYIKVGSAGQALLTAAQVGNGQKVTITGVNLSPVYTNVTSNGQTTTVTSYETVVLTLVNKLIPPVNSYVFSATNDADSTGTRPASPGTGNEQKTLVTYAPGATTAGNLTVVSTSNLAGQPNQTVTITYKVGGQLSNGTVVFTLPTGFTALQNTDQYTLPGGNIAALTSQISGQVITLTGINASVNQNIVLTLNNKTIPAKGAYNFSAKADADGTGLITPSSGIGSEAFTFNATDETAPTVTVATQTVTDGPGQTVDVTSSEGTGKVYLILATAPQATVNDFDAAITAKKGASANVTTAGTAVAISTAGLVNGDYLAYAVDEDLNISAPSGDATVPSGNIVTVGDGIAPVVTAAIQAANDQAGQTVNVSSSDSAGSVYIILSTVTPQTTLAELDAAATAHQGAKAVVTAANIPIPVSTTGLAAGTYYAYAVDTAGNISVKGANPITITAIDVTSPVVTAAAQTVTNVAGKTVNVSSNEGTGKVYIINSTVSPQASVADFVYAIAQVPPLGASANVVSANANVAISVENLAQGTYYAYAVDGAGNISAVGTNPITITSGTPPTLVPATTATVDGAFDITFAQDNSAWRAAITSITVDGTALPPAAYNISTANKITLNPSQSSLLQKPGNKTIKLFATDFSIITINQTIKPGAAASMVMVMQPVAPLTLGVEFTTQPSLKLKDQYGNDCTSDNTSQMSVVKGDTGNWTLAGTGTAGTHITAVNGIFTFTDLTATRNGKVTGAQLTFSVTGLLSVNSLPFTLEAPTGNETTTIVSLTAGSQTTPLPTNLYLNTNITNIAGTATNTNGDLAVVKIRIKQNSTGNYLNSLNNGFFSVNSKVDLVATGTTAWSINLTNVTFSNDTYTVEAIANDGADGAIATYSFIIDKTAPSAINITEPLANRIGVGGYVTLKIVNGPIDNVSWNNILAQIVAKTSLGGQAGCWISGIAPGSLSITPIDGVTAKLINSDNNIATIVSNFDITAGSLTDLAGNVSGLITIYSVISPSPNYISSVTSTDGTKIYVHFDKAMNDPLNDPYIVPDCFTVTKDGVVDKVKTLTLDPNDSNTLILSLTTALTNTQVIMVSYTQGVIRSTDNGVLQSFDAPQYVNNVVFGPPAVITAGTTGDGTKIEIKFSKNMDAQSLVNSDPNCFIVNTGIGDPVTGLSLKSVTDKSTVVLTLQKPITSIQTVTVAYSPGAVKAEDNTILAAFQPRTVTNNVIGPPDYYSSTTTLDGTKVEVTFTKAIKDPNDPNDPRNYNNSFAVIVNNSADVVLAAVLKSSDPSTLLLTLSTPAKFGDTITVAYVAGSVLSADGGILASFTKKNVTNAILQPPKYVSSTTSTDGTKVLVKFDMLMGNPSTNTQNFKVNVSDVADMSNSTVDNITNVALDTDNQVIVLTLNTALTYKKFITVEYTPGDAKAQSGGILAAFTPKTVTNAIIKPPVPMTLTSSDDGKKIEVTFSKTMAAPVAGDESAFKVEINGGAGVSPALMALKAGDSSTYVFTLASPIMNGQTVTFTYVPGTIKAWDGTIMEAFTSKPVVNTVMPPPILVNASTVPDGTKIELTFDKAMAVPANKGFTVLDNLAPDVISSIALKAGDSKTLVLTLQTPILTGEAITIAYDTTTGTIRATDNGILASFGTNPIQAVANTVIAPPTLTAAITSIDGSTVELTFSKAINALPSKSETNFTVVNGGVANTVMSVALKTGDSKTIVLSLKTPVPDTNPQQVVKVTYTPGAILATDNGILAAFVNQNVSNMVVGPPNFVSAATTTDGSQIEVTFDKNIAVLANSDAGSFKVTSGTADPVLGAALKNGNASIVVLTLTTPIKVGISTTIAYTAGTVQSAQGRLLATFAAKPVTNAVIPLPACTSLNTTIDGSAIELKFDTPMADPQVAQLSSFAVTLDGNADALDSNKRIVLKSGTTDTILLYLTTPVNYGNVVKISYTAGTIASTANGLLSSFSSKDVKNNLIAPPTFVSGVTTTDNKKIELKFNKAMGTVIQNSYFTVTTGGNANSVSSVDLKASGSDTLVITLANPIVSGQSINVTYMLPSVMATDKIVAADKGILASTGATPWDVTNSIPATAIITNVTSTNPDGTYNAGQKINITVTFSTPVTVTGIPSLLLETGATDQSAVYVMGSTTNTLTFVYTVQAADNTNDLNYASTAALNLNGGTIRNTGTTIDAILTLPASLAVGELATNKNIKIDSTTPGTTVLSIVSNTDTLATLSVTAQRYGNVYFIVVPAVSTIPNASQIKTGTDGWDFPLPVNLKGTIALTTSLTGTKVITGLTPNTSYKIYVAAEDTAGNIEVTPPYVNLTTDSGADTTPPSFLTHNVAVKNSTTIQIQLKINKNGKAYYVILPDNSVVPSASQIKAGTDSLDTSLSSPMKGSGALIANTDTTLTVSGLTPATAYSVHIAIENTNLPPNVSTTVYSQSITTNVPSDITAPVFTTIPAVSSQTNNTVNISTGLNEDGTIYYVVLPKNSAAPSSAQVKLGLNAAGTAQTLKGSLSLSAGTNGTLGITALTANTTYDVYTVGEDIYSNLQTSTTKVSVTTDSIASLIPPNNIPAYPWAEGGDSFIKIHIKTDKTGKAYYVVLTHGKPAPTTAQVKAAKDGLNASPLKSGNVAITANMESLVTVSALTVSTIYDIYVVAEDSTSLVNLQGTPVRLLMATNPLDLTNVGIDIAAGLITGTTTGMEYSFDATSSTTGTWTACGATNTSKVNFTYGQLYIREKANSSNFRIIANILAPIAGPNLATVTYNVANGVITGMKNNMEYSIAGGLWYPANTNSSNTNVAFSQGAINIRYKATTYTLPSDYSNLGYIFAQPAAPTLTTDDVGNTINNLNAASNGADLYEYKISGSWITGSAFKAGDFDGTKTVQVRLKATATTLAGFTQSLSFTTNMDFSGVALNISTAQINGTTTAMQYSIDSTTGLDGSWKSCAASVTNISLINAVNVYVRAAAQNGNFKLLAGGQTAPTTSGGSPQVTVVDQSGGNKTKMDLILANSLMEYSLDGGLTWTAHAQGTIAGLNLSTAPNNDLRVRYKATSTKLASLPTACLNSFVDLSGVTIDVKNNTINGTNISLEYSFDSTDGLTDGTWAACSYPVTTGLNIAPGKVYVRVAAQPRNNKLFTVAAQAAAPVVSLVPTATNPGTTKLTMLDPTLSYQYIIDTNPTLPATALAWGNAVNVSGASIIDNLAVDPTMYIHIRIVGTTTTLASAIKDIGIQLANIKPALAPSITVASTSSSTAGLIWTTGSVPVSTTDSIEYSYDGSNWTDATTGLTINLNGIHVLYVRTKATTLAPASNSTANLDTTNP